MPYSAFITEEPFTFAYLFEVTCNRTLRPLSDPSPTIYIYSALFTSTSHAIPPLRVQDDADGTTGCRKGYTSSYRYIPGEHTQPGSDTGLRLQTEVLTVINSSV